MRGFKFSLLTLVLANLALASLIGLCVRSYYEPCPWEIVRTISNPSQQELSKASMQRACTRPKGYFRVQVFEAGGRGVGLSNEIGYSPYDSLDSESGVEDVRESPDGTRAILSCDDDIARVFDLKDRTLLFRLKIPPHQPEYEFQFANFDEAGIAILTGDRFRIDVWEKTRDDLPRPIAKYAEFWLLIGFIAAFAISLRRDVQFMPRSEASDSVIPIDSRADRRIISG